MGVKRRRWILDVNFIRNEKTAGKGINFFPLFDFGAFQSRVTASPLHVLSLWICIWPRKSNNNINLNFCKIQKRT